MTFTLGYTPEKFKVEVSAGSDFFASLRRSDGTDWPTGSSLELDFGVGVAPWVAVYVDDVATFNVDQNDVDDVIAAKPKKIKLWYVEGGTRLLWGTGVLVAS